MSDTGLDRLRQLPGFRACGADQYEARCPAHEDRVASLSIGVDSGKILLHCHAGCSLDRILGVIGLSRKDLFADSNGNGHKPAESRIIATYDYVDQDGKLSYQVVRFEPKDFRQRRPDGNGGWTWSVRGIKRVPYRLPELIGAEYVYIAEGEKDVESLRKIGLVGTCNPGGAGKWTAELSQYFRSDQHVTIIPDNDEPGRKHAEQVAASLAGKVASIKVLKLDGLLEKGDVSDWLQGRDPQSAAEELCLLSEAAPEWKQEEAPEHKDPWDVCLFTLADAFRPRPPRSYLVEGLFSIPSMTFAYGSPGCFKSALLTDMAICVASGLPWLPQDPYDASGLIVEKSPVMWIDFDNGDISHNRFEAFARARNLPESLDTLHYAIMPDPWLDATNSAHIDALSARLAKRNIKLLIIDNFRTISGNLDENKPEISIVMTHFRRIVDKLGIALIIIHHPPKADDEILRGHSSINGAIDLSLHIRRNGNDDNISVKPIKVRGAMPNSFGARFDYEHKPGTKELLTARFWRTGAQAGKPLSPAEKEVWLICTRSDEITIQDIASNVKKISPETARRTAWALAGRGMLTRIDGSGSGKTAVFQPVRNGVAHLK